MHSATKNNLEQLTGIQQYKDACIVIVKTEWNSHITNVLEASCIGTLQQHQVTNILQYTVPGAVELPFAIRSIVHTASQKIDAVIAFGCVIKGGTPHFEYVCQSVTQGITTLNLTLQMPIIFGILTVDYEDQALARIKPNSGNKGKEAAITALKMLAYKL